ncbi:solute carrier family 13 member 2-like isoform X1 [Macrobrachium rosenbergii]|uniref:solute carrier family 13 member 2-like isoform X1 n=1 Tax=Macrobrachium rosenbergii TaxID=79674 RepID=UPI0034D698BD
MRVRHPGDGVLLDDGSDPYGSDVTYSCVCLPVVGHSLNGGMLSGLHENDKHDVPRRSHGSRVRRALSSPQTNRSHGHSSRRGECGCISNALVRVTVLVGQSPARLMAGFMIVTTFLSMWISNTATTAMMVSIVNAILDELYPESIHDKKDELETSDNTDKNKLEMVPTGVDNQGYVIDNPRVQVDAENGETATGGSLDIVTKSADEENRDTKPMKTERDLMARALLLGVAYSSNTGGTGVVTGTAPNLVMMSVLENSFSQPSGLNFATWILFNVPGMLVCNLLAWIWLQILFMGLGCKKGGVQKASKEKEEAVKRLISRKYEELGRITQHEITVLLLFFLLVALWLFRAPEIYSWLVIDLHPQ